MRRDRISMHRQASARLAMDDNRRRMQTPWGDLSVSDAHVHFFSSNFLRILGSQLPQQLSTAEVTVKLGWPAVPDSPVSLAHQWVAELDRQGVRRACLIASIPGDEDSVAQAVHAVPERFFGYFFVDPTQEGVADRVHAALSQGLHGVCLLPAMHRYSVADDRVKAVLDVVQTFPKTIVFVQSGVLSVGVRKKLGLPSPFDLRYSNPVDLHPVALRYPKVRFVIPHFGAGFFREALMVCDLCPNVYLDTSSSNSWTCYMTPKPSLAHIFAQAIEICGPRRLLFGTDSSFFPRGWNHAILAQQLEALREAGAGQVEARQILSENLHEFLGVAAG
jgi:predicted TIM-barrel fold metal-dependent hydrolase